MIITPNVDILQGAQRWSAPGTVPLACDCGSTDLFSIAPGGEGQMASLSGQDLPLTLPERLRCWCWNCWERKFGCETKSTGTPLKSET